MDEGPHRLYGDRDGIRTSCESSLEPSLLPRLIIAAIFLIIAGLLIWLTPEA